MPFQLPTQVFDFDRMAIDRGDGGVGASFVELSQVEESDPQLDVVPVFSFQ